MSFQGTLVLTGAWLRTAWAQTGASQRGLFSGERMQGPKSCRSGLDSGDSAVRGSTAIGIWGTQEHLTKPIATERAYVSKCPLVTAPSHNDFGNTGHREAE